MAAAHGVTALIKQDNDQTMTIITTEPRGTLPDPAKQPPSFARYP